MIEIGQVLSLKIRFNNSGAVASVSHPVLVLGIDDNKKVFMTKEEIISLNEDLK